jgi:Uma2 family endonuclease
MVAISKSRSPTTTFGILTAWSLALLRTGPQTLSATPVVIFEVLSPSTAAQDRIVKAREYQATPSVQRYVMLEQDRIGATVHVRAQDGWSVLVLKDEDALAMPEIGLSIPLAEFYEGLRFDADSVGDHDNDQLPPAMA